MENKYKRKKNFQCQVYQAVKGGKYRAGSGP